MVQSLNRRGLMAAAALATAALAGLATGPARAQEPIKIGFGMALTGPLGANGKSALLAMKIWEEDINAKGGLLGRPVQLINYDDQSNPSTVPGIYTKLLDVDKVDAVIGGYATNMLAPAMPVVMQRKKAFIGLYGLGVNEKFIEYARPLIQGEVKVPIEDGLPKYVVLEKSMVEKKLPPRA